MFNLLFSYIEVSVIVMFVKLISVGSHYFFNKYFSSMTAYLKNKNNLSVACVIQGFFYVFTLHYGSFWDAILTFDTEIFTPNKISQSPFY